MIQVGIVGASGYAGGELLRLLLPHPEVEVTQVTSERHLGRYVYSLHPNLRAQTTLRFISPHELQPCDLLFLALPHGEVQKALERYAGLTPHIIDLSADFRLQDPATYRRWYGSEHLAPEWLSRFVYGLPELHRSKLRAAEHISGVGCNATAAILALLPLVQAGLLDLSRPVIVDVKVGSSEAGASPNVGSHHPERSGVIRTYAPTGHRHTAEVLQALHDLLRDRAPADLQVYLSITSVDLVRGALAAAHAFCKPEATARDLWSSYRAWTSQEPFVRLVKEQRGNHRVPDPKILAGTNYADVGFELDPDTGRVVALAAIDNLMKGAAGSAVQSMNLMLGFEETTGLEFSGLHPI